MFYLGSVAKAGANIKAGTGVLSAADAARRGARGRSAMTA